MLHSIVVRNPSSYPRRGFAAIPWQPIFEETRIPPEELVLVYRGSKLKAQVDYQEDPTRAMLTFFVDREIPEGRDDYSKDTCHVEIQAGTPPRPGGPIVLEQDHGLNLVNGRLNVYLNLTPYNDRAEAWLAGAACSVVLD